MVLFLGIEDAALLLENNIYLRWLLGVGPMYLIGFPILYFVIKGMKTTEREKSKISAPEFLSIFLMCQAVMLVGNIIGQTLNSYIGAIIGKEVVNNTSELIDSSPIWLVISVAVIIGPVIEELIFRKLMIDRLSKYGDAVAIIVSSVSFGLFHGNLYQFFYSAMLGFLLGYLYTKTGDIKYPILLHVLINFVGSVAIEPVLKAMQRLEEFILALEGGADIDMSGLLKDYMIVSSYSVIQYAAAVAGIIMLVNYFKNKKFKLNGICEYKLPKERAFGAIVLNTGTILFLVLSLILFAVSVFMV